MITKFWRKKQGRPYETSCSIFFISFKQLVINIAPKKINHMQQRVIFVIWASYLIIKVITKFWKFPRDVLIRRPAKYFSSVLRLLSTYLPKNQIICSTGWNLSLRHHFSWQKWSQSSEEKTQGRSYETSCSIFINSIRGAFKKRGKVGSTTA